ncbi:MAG: hypothetical protein J5680_03895 [Neisseriaceae bacterium]|nr:hypothetical protein [Neisseriaceae bacterium]MBR5676022.1 hypothetical protein [Neisseriaceae bacterium]
MYFNNFYSALSGGLVGKNAHPTALLVKTAWATSCPPYGCIFSGSLNAINFKSIR